MDCFSAPIKICKKYQILFVFIFLQSLHQKNFLGHLRLMIFALSLSFYICIILEMSVDSKFTQFYNRINHCCWQTNVLRCFSIFNCILTIMFHFDLRNHGFSTIKVFYLPAHFCE